MDPWTSSSITTIEIELSASTYGPFVRQKVEEEFTEEERSQLEFTVEDCRMTISGSAVLLQRVQIALHMLGKKE
jgi:hypothetical protein